MGGAVVHALRNNNVSTVCNRHYRIKNIHVDSFIYFIGKLPLET